MKPGAAYAIRTGINHGRIRVLSLIIGHKSTDWNSPANLVTEYRGIYRKAYLRAVQHGANIEWRRAFSAANRGA